MNSLDFIDLGLPSGTRWCNTNYTYYIPALSSKSSIPTIENFKELISLCNIRGYEKGDHKFLLIVGPNKNTMRIIISTVTTSTLHYFLVVSIDDRIMAIPGYCLCSQYYYGNIDSCIRPIYNILGGITNTLYVQRSK